MLEAPIIDDVTGVTGGDRLEDKSSSRCKPFSWPGQENLRDLRTRKLTRVADLDALILRHGRFHRTTIPWHPERYLPSAAGELWNPVLTSPPVSEIPRSSTS